MLVDCDISFYGYLQALEFDNPIYDLSNGLEGMEGVLTGVTLDPVDEKFDKGKKTVSLFSLTD